MRITTFFELGEQFLFTDIFEMHIYWSRSRFCRYISLFMIKVSKSQMHFFLKLHCPTNEWNIWQNSRKNTFLIYWPICKSDFKSWMIPCLYLHGFSRDISLITVSNHSMGPFVNYVSMFLPIFDQVSTLSKHIY